MSIKNVKVSLNHHEKLNKLCFKHKMKQKDFIESCIDLFDKTGENPKDIKNIISLRDTFISFIRTQEQKHLIPIKKDISLANDKIEDIMKTLKFILKK